jgi:hypothetical protein
LAKELQFDRIYVESIDAVEKERLYMFDDVQV